MHKLNILICDDMEHVRNSHQHHIEQCAGTMFKPQIQMAQNGVEAVELIKESISDRLPFDIIFLDIDFSHASNGNNKNGFEVANAIQKISPSTVIVIVSAYSTEDNLMLAEQSPHVHRFFRRGEFSKNELSEVCGFALIRKLHSKNELLSAADTSFTSSDVMKNYLKRVDQVSSKDNVVIYGETGAGKELSAKRLNANAKLIESQKERPFVVINCGGLTDTLRTSELFGYVRGAFTGANQDTPGLLEKAEGGDVFLDELQNAPRNLQEVLMRVLQDKEFIPVGGRQSKKLNVRFITALNKHPSEAKKSGAVMPDLLARLQHEYLVIPSLKDRKGDVRALIEYFQKNEAKADKTFSADALSLLESMTWPTNVRGLRSVVLEAIRHSKIPLITSETLMRLPSLQEMLSDAPDKVEQMNDSSVALPLNAKIEAIALDCLQDGVSLPDQIKQLEKTVLSRLWLEKKSIAQVSRRTKLPETTVRRKLTEYGIASF